MNKRGSKYRGAGDWIRVVVPVGTRSMLRSYYCRSQAARLMVELMDGPAGKNDKFTQLKVA